MKRNEDGIALVITLFLMATLSALAVSMMFLAQTETAASRNYRTMSQARYSAEAGVHQMANYLMYTGYSPTSNYDASKVPVTCTGGSCAHTTTGSCSPTTIATAVSTGCVVLGYSAATSNNPTAATNTAATGTLAMNGSGTTTNAALGTATYAAAAILMSIKTVTPYGSSTPQAVQTWQIISDGTVPPSTAAIVEVSSTIEREVGFATTYAVFATNADCGAITISGNSATTSYSSAGLGTGSAWSGGTVGSGTPNTVGTGGAIGTNGNLNVSGSVAIGGTLSTPRTGAGACSNSNVNAITGTGTWSYGGTRQLSQSVTYPTPTIPSGIPTTSVSIDSGDAAGCTAAVSASGWACSVSGTQVTLRPTSLASTTLTLGNVSIAANTDVVIAGPALAVGTTAVTLNVNSFKIGNNGSFSLADGSLSTYKKANILMNIAGQGLTSPTRPLDLSGGGSVNTGLPTGVVGVSAGSGFDPTRFQIMYAGTDEIDMVGNNDIAATLYAPNAFVKTTGHGNLYGSVLASTFRDTGGAKINYDTSMATKFSTLGNFMLTSFSWKKY